MRITNKGKGWEVRNSFWLIWVFVMLFNWIAFFWIGGRAKQRKWVLFGCMYMVLCFVGPLVAVAVFKDDEIMENIFFGTYFIAWIGSIIHAFLSRREYLIRREAIVANQAAAAAAFRQKIQNEYAQPHGYPQQPMPVARPQQSYPPQNYTQHPIQNTAPARQVAPFTQKLNLNTCSEQELEQLPGVSVALAKRAIDMRVQLNGFKSVPDFCHHLDLMPHFVVQIENIAFVAPIQPKPPSQERTGRVIDI